MKKIIILPVKRLFFLAISCIYIFTSIAYATEDDEIRTISKHPSHVRLQEDSSLDIEKVGKLYAPSTRIDLVEDLQTQLADDLSVNELSRISQAYIAAFKDEHNSDGSSNFFILKGLISICGFGAGIPFIEGALDAGKFYGLPDLGYLFATATVLYSGGIAAWTIWELIENCESPRGGLSFYADRDLKYKLGKTGLSLALAALTSAPTVYLAYKFNTVKGLAIMSLCYECILRSLGFYKFITSLNRKKINTICEDQSNKKFCLEVVDLSKAYFLNLHHRLNASELALLLERYHNPRDLYLFLSSPSSHDQVPLLSERQMMPYYFANGVPRKIAQYASLIFPSSGALVNSILAYKAFNLLTDNTAVLFILAGASVFPTFVLDSFATQEVAGGIFDGIYSLKYNVLPSEYFQAFHPKIKKAIIITAVILGVSSAGGGIYLLLDSLDNTFLGSTRYLFTALAAVTTVKFGAYAVTNTLMNFGTVITKKIKTSTSYTFDCLRKLGNLRNLIWESGQEQTQQFLDEVRPTSFYTDAQLEQKKSSSITE